MLACTSFLSTPLSAASDIVPEPEFLIAGLYINDVEKDGADLYQDGGQFWLPLEQLSQWAEFEFSPTVDSVLVSTPLGDVDIAASQLIEMPEGLHINLNALKEAGIQAKFDTNSYALLVYAPWIGIAPKTEALVSSPKPPDFHPPQSGVARFYNRFETNYDSDTSNSSSILYSDAMGYFVNGVWGLQTTTSADQNTKLSQLYWNTYNRYAAMRLGTATAYPGPLLNTPDFSGLQLGYSNHSIYNHLATSASATRQMFVDDASYSHDISGTGPRGGIAELRLNERPIARVRIALDGQFLFKRLPVGRSNTDRVEVALYEFSLAQPPINVIDYTIASKPRAVSTGEIVLNGGIGREGATIDESTEGELTSYGSMRYGVSNFLTLEAATQQRAEQDDGLYLGVIASLGANFATSLGTARIGDTDINGAELWGTWETFRAKYKGKEERNKATNTSSLSQDLSVHWQLNDKFSVNVRGLQKKEDNETTEEYLAAGFNWKMTPNATLSLQPIDGDEYDARLSLRSLQGDAYLQFRAAPSSYGVSLNYAVNEALNIAADYSETDEIATTSTAAYYRPRHNNDSVYSAQLSRQQSRIGYSLGWQYRLSPHTQFGFSYFRRIDDDDALLESVALSDSESVSVSIESELWFSKQSWRASHLKTDSTHGAVSARIFDVDGNVLDSDNIRLKIEGAQSSLRPGENGEQTLTGLPPGDYNLKLLAEGLPIEYENSQSSLRVRIAPAATTDVEITLKAHYGVAGLVSVNQQPVPHEWVDIWQDGIRVSEGKTDSYGYYQITGLQPGVYEVRYGDMKQSFELVDDYIFDINLGINDADTLVAAGTPAHDKPESAALFSNLDTALETAVNTVSELTDIGIALPAGLTGRIYYGAEPLGHVTVQLQRDGRKIASLSSDRYGYYSFHHLSPGEYRVAAGNTVNTFVVTTNRTYDADLHLDEQSVVQPNKTHWLQQ